MNRAGSIDEQLRFAIGHKLLIQVSYGGGVRVLEPHDYGVQKGLSRLLAHQIRRSGGAPGGSITGWRLLDVAKIGDCVVLEETFPGSRGDRHQHHYVWDVVHARVE